jgi:tight adherence protein B
MIAAPAMLLAAGVAAGVAVARLRWSVILRRITPERVPSVPIPRRLTIPGPGWPWWPIAGALVGWVADGVIAAIVGAVVVKVGAATMGRRNEARVAATLDEQLADAVRSFAAGMRAGLSVTQAIAFAAKEGEPPLAPTLVRIVDSVSLGGSLDDALHGWARDVGTDDARLVVGVLTLHRRSGGDLPRVLDQVAATLRERTESAREIRALTAQARLSGAILGLLPIGFFAFLWMTSRGNIEGAFDSPIGIAAIVTGAVLECIAFVWIRSLLVVA